MDIRDLVQRIERVDALDKVTRSKLAARIEKMNEEEIEKKIEENQERLNRISKWLVVLKEVESVGE